jgi:hypothetical protein
VASSLPGRIHEEDFADFYAAAAILRSGGNPYRTSLTPVGEKLGLHPKGYQGDTVIPETPTLLVCLKALGALPIQQAYWTWIAVNLAALAAALYFLLADSSLEFPDVCLLVALALLYPPLSNLFMTAQTQTLVILALALAMRWLAAGREGAAGVVLGAAALLRGFPVMMGIYLLLTRKWRALLFMIAIIVLGLASTAMVLGWSEMLDFPRAVSRITVDRALFQLAWNVSPRAFIWRLCLYLSRWRLNPVVDGFGMVLGSAASLIFFLFALKATERYATEPDRDFRLFSLWVVTSIIVLPITWLNYTTVLFILFATIVSASIRSRVSTRVEWAAIASYFLSLFAFGGLVLIRPGALKLPLMVVIGETKTVSLLVAYLSAYWFAADWTFNEVNIVGALSGDSPNLALLTNSNKKNYVQSLQNPT